jgi:molybdopterin synthase catalytic subunit
VCVGLVLEEVQTKAARDFCVCPGAGGTVVFEGTTRDTDGKGRRVVKLVYEAYESMAVSEMKKLALRAADTWPLHAVYMMHRLGTCPVAEGSVVVAVASKHRAEAFRACEFLIDQLKARVPIWKQEWVVDGESGEEEGWWRANCLRCAEAAKHKEEGGGSGGEGGGGHEHDHHHHDHHHHHHHHHHH